MEIDYTKIKYSKEWFDNPENQAHTIFDVIEFRVESCNNIIHVGDRFLLDLCRNDEDTDSEIWEVQLTQLKHYNKKRRQKFNFICIQKITNGKQFSYPNGYWKVKNNGGDECDSSQ